MYSKRQSIHHVLHFFWSGPPMYSKKNGVHHQRTTFCSAPYHVLQKSWSTWSMYSKKVECTRHALQKPWSAHLMYYFFGVHTNSTKKNWSFFFLAFLSQLFHFLSGQILNFFLWSGDYHYLKTLFRQACLIRGSWTWSLNKISDLVVQKGNSHPITTNNIYLFQQLLYSIIQCSKTIFSQ